MRYLYIPLGGRNNKILNIWAVFTYVALWHDFQLNLVLWAWGVCLCMMGEILVKTFFTSRKMNWIWRKWYFTYIVLYADGLLIVMMVVANLIGFGYGWNGITYFYNRLLKIGPDHCKITFFI